MHWATPRSLTDETPHLAAARSTLFGGADKIALPAIIVLQDGMIRMDRLATLSLFVRIADRGSFSTAAADLGISRPVATAAIKALEERLGTRLLQRSTRHVQPTVEGRSYYQRCVSVLADLEDADRAASGEVAGSVRVDVVGYLARKVLLPALPEFLARHPQLTVHLGEGERLIDLVREGVDCVVRAGELDDSDMVVRRLGMMQEVTVASTEYLAAHGTPTSPDDLQGHYMIGFVSSRTGQPLPLEFTRNGKVIEISLPARLLVSSADTSAAAVREGLGLVQAPRHRFAEDIASGAMIEVLADFPPTPTPLSVLYPSNRHLSARVRVFVDWLVETIGPRLRGSETELP